jgi:O-antigen ligase
MSARPLTASPALGTAGFAAGLLLGLGVVATYAVGGLLAVAVVGALAVAAVLVLLFGTERVLVCAILVNLPLQIDAYLGYRVEDAALGALGGVQLSVTTLSLLLLAARGLLVPGAAPWATALRSARAWIPLALLLGLSALSVAWARDPTLAVYGLLSLLQPFVLFVYLSAALRTAADVRRTVDFLLVGLLLETACMVLQFAGVRLPGLLASEVWRSQAGGAVLSRVSGTLGTPNGAAAYLSVLLVIAFAVLMARPGRRRTWLAGAALASGGVGLALTLSRGGMLGAGAGVAVFVLLATRRRLLRIGPLLLAGALAAALAAVFGGELLARSSDLGGDGNGRVPLMVIAARMILSHPLVGVGANNFVAALPEFTTPEFSLTWIYVVHNYYLQVAAELGLLGLTLFVAFLASVARCAWTASRGSPGDLTLLAIGIVAALVVRAVHMQVDVFGGPSGWEMLVVLAAVASALARQAEHEVSGPAASPSPPASHGSPVAH